MTDLKARLTAWYNLNVAARWWASSAMWVGIAAGLVEYLPDYIQMGLDQMDILGGVFDWTDATKRSLQALMLFVVLPIAKAWRQKKMQQAQIKQAAETGLVIPLAPSGVSASVVLDKTDPV